LFWNAKIFLNGSNTDNSTYITIKGSNVSKFKATYITETLDIIYHTSLLVFYKKATSWHTSNQWQKDTLITVYNIIILIMIIVPNIGASNLYNNWYKTAAVFTLINVHKQGIPTWKSYGLLKQDRHMVILSQFTKTKLWSCNLSSNTVIQF